MIREQQNLVPVLLAALLHAAIVAAMVFAFELPRRARPATPLAIQGTLVTAEQQPAVPAVAAPEPEPEPAPPQPDPAEQQRLEAERLRRQQEQEAEQERVRQQQEAEQERIRQQQAAEQRRLEQEAEERRRREEAERQREAEERRRREEAELERQRAEAERRRQEELERQRQENERRRREAEEAERMRQFQQELAAEEARLAALSSGEMDAYVYAIQQRIERAWVAPASAVPGLECVILVRQVPGGQVIGATIESCNGDAAVRRSIEAAVFKASPLPEPSNPTLFERNLRITFKPEQ